MYVVVWNFVRGVYPPYRMLLLNRLGPGGCTLQGPVLLQKIIDVAPPAIFLGIFKNNAYISAPQAIFFVNIA